MSDLSLKWSAPIRLDIPRRLAEEVKPILHVVNRSADFQLKKAKRSETWLRNSLGDEGYDQRILALSQKRERSLLREDELGFWAPSGARDLISRHLGVKIHRSFNLPEPSPLPWRITPREFLGGDPFDHQLFGAAAITDGAGPTTIELPCGTGKSLIFALVLRELGRPAAVLASSRVIADQLYRLLLQLLGERFVGQYNGDSKGVGKLITVCSAMATKNLRPGGAAWDHLSRAEVLLGDECHTFAAEVLEAQAMGVFSRAVWRGFATASKVRGDGLEKVLLGVVGPTAYGLTFRQAVDLRLLARPHLVSVEVDSGVDYLSRDPDRMTRAHLYQSERVVKLAGDMTAGFMAAGYSVLLLVEEFPQAALLSAEMPEAIVMHGGTGSFSVVVHLDGAEPLEVSPGRSLLLSTGAASAESLLDSWREGSETYLLPVEGEGPPLRIVGVRRSKGSGQELLAPHLRDREVPEVQRDFNESEGPVAMIATSAGRVGVDLRPSRGMAVLYLVGGTSEVSLIQGMGRATRPYGKSHFIFVDFRIPALERHFLARREILERIWERPIEMSADDIRKVWSRS